MVIPFSNYSAKTQSLYTLLYLNADYFSWPFMITNFVFIRFENRSLLKPVIGGVTSVAHLITGYEQTQS